MARVSNGLQEGRNKAATVSQVICLDWYDGPVAGLLRVGETGPVYRFELVDDRQRIDFSEDRAYALFPVARKSFDRLVSHLQKTHSPKWPVWVPIWTFPSEKQKEKASALTRS